MHGVKTNAAKPLILDPGRAHLAQRLDLLLGRLVLPWMAVTFVLYIAVHSPLRDMVASMLRMQSRGCFFCTYPLTLDNFLNGLSSILFVIAAITAGWMLADQFAAPAFDRVLSFGLYGLALITLPASALGGIAYASGLKTLHPPLGPVVSSLPAVVIASLGLWKGWRPHKILSKMARPNGLLAVIASLAGVMLFSASVISLSHPPSGYDALSYHGPLSIFLWQDGNLGAYLDRAPSTWFLAHPGTAEIWLGLLRLIGGGAFAKLGQLPFAFLGCAAVFAFTRRLGMAEGSAWLAAASFLLMPMVIMQSVLQLNDLIGAALVMAAFALACAPFQRWTPARFILIGIGLGLAVTTKLVLLPGAAVLGLMVVIAIVTRRFGTKIPKQVWTGFALFAISFLVLAAPWWTRNILLYKNPVYPAALPFLGRGFFFSSFAKADAAFVPAPAAWLIYPLIEPLDEQSGLGAIFLGFAFIGFIVAAWRGRRQPVLMFAGLTVGMIVSWWFLSERFPRFLLAPASLACAFIPWSFGAVDHGKRRVVAILMIAGAAFTCLVTFDQAILPFARQPISRNEFYDQVWAVDPAALSLPEVQGILWQTGYSPALPEYTAYYPLLGRSFSRLVLPVGPGATTASILGRMRQFHVQYAYVTIDPENLPLVQSVYGSKDFELIHQSEVVKGDLVGAQRSLFRPATGAEAKIATFRFLYRLRQP